MSGHDPNSNAGMRDNIAKSAGATPAWREAQSVWRSLTTAERAVWSEGIVQCPAESARADTSRRQSKRAFTDVHVQPRCAAHLEWRMARSAPCVGRLLAAPRSAGRPARRRHGGRVRSSTFAERLLGRAYQPCRFTRLPAHHCEPRNEHGERQSSSASSCVRDHNATDSAQAGPQKPRDYHTDLCISRPAAHCKPAASGQGKNRSNRALREGHFYSQAKKKGHLDDYPSNWNKWKDFVVDSRCIWALYKQQNISDEAAYHEFVGARDRAGTNVQDLRRGAAIANPMQVGHWRRAQTNWQAKPFKPPTQDSSRSSLGSTHMKRGGEICRQREG